MTKLYFRNCPAQRYHIAYAHLGVLAASGCPAEWWDTPTEKQRPPEDLICKNCLRKENRTWV